MKARILTVILLMSVLVSFAQTSRRESSEGKANANSRKKSDVKQEEKGKSQANQRTYSNSSTRQETHSTERKEANRVQQVHKETVPENRRMEHGDTHNFSHGDTHHSSHGDTHNSSHGVVVYHDHRRHDVDRRTVVVTSSPRRVEEVHRVHYYRAPVRTEIYWTVDLSRDFRIYYPEVHYWKYSVGHRIVSIPAYDAVKFVGEAANVYGRVVEVYYEPQTDEFFLYYGDNYPYQDFSVAIAGREAREFSPDPVRYFEGQYITTTGYIQDFDGKPQMVVNNSRQIGIY
jgi:hypothetical protein